MQVDICFEAFSKPDGFTSRGGYLTTPLYLWRHPMEDLEAATKKYIDDKINNISNLFNGKPFLVYYWITK